LNYKNNFHSPKIQQFNTKNIARVSHEAEEHKSRCPVLSLCSESLLDMYGSLYGRVYIPLNIAFHVQRVHWWLRRGSDGRPTQNGNRLPSIHVSVSPSHCTVYSIGLSSTASSSSSYSCFSCYSTAVTTEAAVLGGHTVNIIQHNVALAVVVVLALQAQAVKRQLQSTINIGYPSEQPDYAQPEHSPV